MEEIEPPSTLPKLLAQVVAARGPYDAIATSVETLSYDELDRRTAKMARALLAIGAGKGARIALMAPDGVLWLTTYLGALRIGALTTLVSTLCTPRNWPTSCGTVIRRSSSAPAASCATSMMRPSQPRCPAWRKARPKRSNSPAHPICVRFGSMMRLGWAGRGQSMI